MSVSGLAPFDRRGHHRRVVIEALRRSGAASRAEIAEATGLSAQTVSTVTDELCREGLVSIVGRRASARGQPPIDLALALDGGFAVGAQVEPGRMTGILVDLGAHVRAERSIDCDTGRPDLALPSLIALVAELVEQGRIARARLWGVGIALPGPFGDVAESEQDPLAMAAWSRLPFREAFSAGLNLPVIVGNDATAAAIGEHLHGVARDLRSFVYLYLAEGIGGGLFVEGQPVTGAFGNAGEIGRMIVGHDPDRGGLVTLEARASLHALRRMLGEAGVGDADNCAVERLFEGHEAIVACWIAEAARHLRIAIANIENLLDPETIVIGGQVPERVLAALMQAIAPLPASVSQRKGRLQPRLLTGRAGRNSPALGGATLPLFSGLTPHPRAAKLPKPARAARASELGKTRPANGRRDLAAGS
ncbi:ROK family transcriptional regulator [Bosea sp. BIWAKO-01]|uniref:ROK family transcriptional regulator n=1 Tax=Bosea sp. BIWAKO-01 TaxID=506668 RepID=UPI000853DDDB|nr:ROK family transcriptional regulator [Bosea sp. BIWAKO-01]GAU81459.1 NagC-like transcriptional regulator of glucosamine ABC transporter and kinase cluster [Bosea sp. BIWAKO-01]